MRKVHYLALFDRLQTLPINMNLLSEMTAIKIRIILFLNKGIFNQTLFITAQRYCGFRLSHTNN